MKQISVRATYMRGGTSKGVFFTPQDLPDHVRDDAVSRDALLLRIIGSPDPYGKQIDGMGGGTSSTSKVVLVSKSERPDCDVDYLFGAVSIDQPLIDWSGNCGNLVTAVGPFAIARGLINAPAEGSAEVRIWQANTSRRIIAKVPMQAGEVVETGDFEVDGVTFPAARIELEFLDPGGDGDGLSASALFPTGRTIDVLQVPGLGKLDATLINAGNPTAFVKASALGLRGTEMQSDINSDAALLDRLETIRALAAVAMGLAESTAQATAERPATPKLAFVAPPEAYISVDGRSFDAAASDLSVRIMSMGKLHHALTGTGGVALAAAAALAGTVVADTLRTGPQNAVRAAHPSGILHIGAEVQGSGDSATVERVRLSRTARRLMDGWVMVPSSS